ncbi:hypothetical protein C5B73_04015 [Nocardia cyriacigeorgica]|nr:hypothetical protein C5B73_04015 [Nocardia cyriacigeorgica]
MGGPVIAVAATDRVETVESVWVVTYRPGEPRNGASGLVPRRTSAVPAWDYYAAARRHAATNRRGD